MDFEAKINKNINGIFVSSSPRIDLRPCLFKKQSGIGTSKINICSHRNLNNPSKITKS